MDSTLLLTLNQLETQQTLPTYNTLKYLHPLLHYAHTYQTIYLQFNASNKILHIDAGASYLVLPKAHSRIAGYFCLSNNDESLFSHGNGAILIECKGLRWVVSSAIEVEACGVFHNVVLSVNLCILLLSMGRPQPPTPIVTDNAVAGGFVNQNIQLKKVISWNMHLHWLKNG